MIMRFKKLHVLCLNKFNNLKYSDLYQFLIHDTLQTNTIPIKYRRYFDRFDSSQAIRQKHSLPFVYLCRARLQMHL